MQNNAEKYAWLIVGIAAFSWLPIVAILFLLKSEYLTTFICIAFCSIGITYLVEYAPWKHKHIKFGIIYLGFIVILVFSALITTYLWDPINTSWKEITKCLIYLLPLFIPYIVYRNTGWDDLFQKTKK